MNDYELKKQAKIERLKERAQNARDQAKSYRDASDAITEHIPLGQPILIGHHSEGRHRRDLERSRNNMDRSMKELEKAESYERRAEAAEKSTAIHTEDPESVKKMKEKIEKLETERYKMKKINAAWRKFEKTGDRSILEAVGVKGESIDRLIETINAAYSWEKQPFAKWQLSNLGQQIRNAKLRLVELEKVQDEKTTEKEIKGVRIVDNVEDNRLQLFFPGKPSEAIRTELKNHGFRWSPYNKCWQRHRSPTANHLAKMILEDYNE